MSKMNNEKFILDATAGFRMMWFNKAHPNALYIDQRTECNPDEVQDFRDLPYPDETFRLVVFDPPHLIDRWQPKKDNSSPFAHWFGLLRAETWQSDLKRAFRELFRVLKPEGVLLFKWSNHDIPFKRVLPLFEIQPLFGQTTSKWTTKHGNNKTAWFCFMKIPNNIPKITENGVEDAKG